MSISIPCSEAAPHVARSAVRQALGDDAAVDAALLATSEVVSNAVIHAGLSAEDAIDLFVENDDGRVRIRVAHPGPDFHWSGSEPDRDTPGGFGLHIVGSVTDRWDITHSDGRTETWFEI